MNRKQEMTGSMTLAEMRRAKGLTQREVALKMGVARPRVSQIEKGFPYVRFDVVQSYLSALDAVPTVVLSSGDCVMVREEEGVSAVRDRDRGDRTAFQARNRVEAQAS